MELAGGVGVALSVTLLSFAVTKCVDVLRNAFDVSGKAPKVIWNVAALAVSFVLAFAFDVNLLASVGFEGSEVVGQTVTALMLTGGGSAGHDLLSLAANKARQLRG